MANKHGKNYQRVAGLVDTSRMYPPDEAATLVKETTYVKFDPTVVDGWVFRLQGYRACFQWFKRTD